MKCIADPQGNDKGGQCGECAFVGHETDCPCFERDRWWVMLLRLFIPTKPSKAQNERKQKRVSLGDIPRLARD